ncbi:MAG: peptidoglycan editing factor PgeF [Pseudomonadota bacterium]
MTLQILKHEGLRHVSHGFFTRKGGASSGIFKGLNCGYGSSDQTETVAMNRARVARTLSVPAERLISVRQVHSADVVTIAKPLDGTDETADAMVTKIPGLALAILTADCQPVLFADAKAGVIGGAHAGWKGTRAGILEATVGAMEALGARRERIVAVIGPSISQRAYEVGPEFMDIFLADDPDNARFFIDGRGDRMHFDLPAYGLDRLRAAGVGHAEWTRHCTYCDAEAFFSHRRSLHRKEADYGRLISAIRL